MMNVQAACKFVGWVLAPTISAYLYFDNAISGSLKTVGASTHPTNLRRKPPHTSHLKAWVWRRNAMKPTQNTQNIQ